ncbi:MAG: hypothetical protein OQK13_03540 [Gammaproteobacteria bacterium]|nr:hypothetical protein [Gammaproteobacteria bacterium]
MHNILSQIWSWLGCNAAEIIATSAMTFTAYQVIVTRRHNKISVRPHLAESSDRNRKPGEGVLAFVVSNNGLGPAVIKKWEVLLDGEEINISDHDAAESVIRDLLKEKEFNFTIGTLGEGYVMPSNELKKVLIVHFKCKSDDDFNSVETSLNSLDLIIEYESMYGEKFKLDTRSNDS